MASGVDVADDSRMSDNTVSTQPHAVRDLAVGVVAGLAGGLAMNLFARATSDRRGHGAQPPQEDSPARGKDAAERAGDAAYRLVRGGEPAPETSQRLGTAAHYAFSASAGAAYGLLAPRVPALTACFGTLFGTLVWAGADEGVVPLLGLSRGPRQIPARVHLFALTAHLVYGAAVETVRRVVSTNDQNAGNQITSLISV